MERQRKETLLGKMAENHACESTKVNLESFKTALVQSNKKITRSSLRSVLRQGSKADQYPDILRSLSS